jgi:hypothetical protein
MRLPSGRNQRFDIGRHAHHHNRFAEIAVIGQQRFDLTEPFRQSVDLLQHRRDLLLVVRTSHIAWTNIAGTSAGPLQSDRAAQRGLPLPQRLDHCCGRRQAARETNTPRERRTIQRVPIHQGTTRMDKSIRPLPREVRSGPDAIPYTKEALGRDLERVDDAWDDFQTDRRRDAIYGYLEAVYDLVTWWSADGCDVDRARQAMRLRGLLPLPREDVFAAMIRCTSDPARMDKRTRSKWSRVLRYVKMEKDEGEALAAFIKRKGGVNECNARYGRCLRRLAASRRSMEAWQRNAASKRKVRG